MFCATGPALQQGAKPGEDLAHEAEDQGPSQPTRKASTAPLGKGEVCRLKVP